MKLTPFKAIATTCDVKPGSEAPGDKGTLHVKGQAFTDIVESSDARIAGVNTPTLDIVIDPASGKGELSGSFVWKPKAGDGTWEGMMEGQIREGLVTARGVACGSGALEGLSLRVDFQQVRESQGQPPCPEPKAFFAMQGLILERA
jgi:hypothetical protein